MTDVMGEIRSLVSEPVLNTPVVRAMIGKLARAGDVEMLAYLAEVLALRETPVEPLVWYLDNENGEVSPAWLARESQRITEAAGRPVIALDQYDRLEYPGGRKVEVVVSETPEDAARQILSHLEEMKVRQAIRWGDEAAREEGAPFERVSFESIDSFWSSDSRFLGLGGPVAYLEGSNRWRYEFAWSDLAPLGQTFFLEVLAGKGIDRFLEWSMSAENIEFNPPRREHDQG